MIITPTVVRRALTLPADSPEPAGQNAAVALILAPAPGAQDELDLLFIRRAVRAGDPWSGHVGLPGGRRSAADSDLIETAIRETAEEVAIDLKRDSLLGALPDLPPLAPVLPPIMVRPFVFALPDHPTPLPNTEVQSAFWVPLSTLAAPNVRQDITIRAGEPPRAGPAYIVGHDTIWGMTERIVTSFFESVAS